MSIQHIGRRALVVLSGGQDSTTCLFWAKRYFGEVHAVTFNYGQRHAREIAAAIAVAALAGVNSHEVIELGPILKGTSPLTDHTASLETYPSFEAMEKTIGDRVELTFVPMRNALFLTLAANRAVVLGCDTVVTGVCEADNANYPDCRGDFILAMQAMVRQALGATAEQITIAAPLLTLSKSTSIQLAKKLGLEAFLALAFSHTAYDGQYPPTGADHASTLRAHGFEQASEPDPLVLRAALVDGLMPLPTSLNYSNHEYNEALVAEIRRLESKLVGVELIPAGTGSAA